MAHGGAREGAGRKPKAEELKVVETGVSAIVKVYGSLENYWESIAEKSKDSFAHQKLLTEYVYGKPKESKDISIKEIPTIDMSKWK